MFNLQTLFNSVSGMNGNGIGSILRCAMKPAIEQSLANNDERKVRRRGRCGAATKSRRVSGFHDATSRAQFYGS